jgi:hypothetical protein
MSSDITPIPSVPSITSPEDAAEQLEKQTNELIDKYIKAAEEEVATVEKDVEARKTGGFWDKITAGPLDRLRQEMSSYSNPQDAMKGQQSLLGKYLNYLDMGQSFAGLATGVVSGVVSSVVKELDIINSVSETLGLGTLMPSGQTSGCAKGVILGTVDSLVTIASSVVSPVVNAAMAAQTTVAMAFDVIPDLYGALASMPAGTLSLLLTNKAKILDNLESTVNSAVALAKEMTDESYPTEHISLIERSMASLEEADGDLGDIDATINGGGSFDKLLWEETYTHLRRVSEDLMGSSLSVDMDSYGKVLQLLGYQRVIDQLTSILYQRQAAISELISSLGGMASTFDQGMRFQNMLSPIIRQIRCSLQQMIADMGETLDVNRLLKFYANEKRWAVELIVLAEYMNSTEGLGQELTHAPTEMNKAADYVSSQISTGMDFFQSEESYDALISRLQSFSAELKRKVASNVDPALLEALGVSVKREIAVQRESNSDLENLLNGFNQSIAGAGLTALQAVSEIMSLLDEQGLDSMVDALKRGDFESFFSGDMLKKVGESAARKALTDVLHYCSENGGDGDLAERAIKLNATLAQWQYSKEIYERYTLKFSELHLSETYKDTIPALQSIKRDVGTMSRARCLNSGRMGSGGGLRLTLY